jgi:hypothetical protein
VDQRGLRLHFVWHGEEFPFYCRLAVESAIVAMPDAHVTIHLLAPVRRGHHLEALTGWSNVTVSSLPLEEVFADCPGGPSRYLAITRRLNSPAALSNLVRLAILHHHGGVYLDTDVIVLRPLHDPDQHGAYVGQEWVWESNRSRVERTWNIRRRVRASLWALRYAAVRLDSSTTGGRLGLAARIDRTRFHRLQVNNAVIGSPSHSAFVEAALTTALEVDHGTRFALGPSLLDDVARALPRSVHLLPPSRFYAVPPGESFRWFEDRTIELPADAHVIHYVASNHRRLLEQLDADDVRFHRGQAPFWKHAREVRRTMTERAASTGRRPTIHLVRW